MKKQTKEENKNIIYMIENIIEQDEASPEYGHLVREPASAYRLGRSGIFSLAPGGFEAHEGDIILTSRDEEKEIHVLERHGTSVTAAFLKSRLSGVLSKFYRLRDQKVTNWKNAVAGAYSRLGRKATESLSDPTKVQKAYEEVEKLLQKIAWAQGIQSHQRDEIMRFLRNEARRKEIAFRATKFYKSDLMRQTVMTVLYVNQEQIDAQLTDKDGNPKAVATQAGPFRHQFSRNIGIGYELNEKMQIVEIATLTKVAVMLIISDRKKRHYKVLTAFPEP